MWDGLEGRKFPRVKANCQIYIEMPNLASPISATTENIGVGGICVVLKQQIPKFSKLRLELDVADGDGPILCEGRVVWSVESREFHSGQSTFDTGIEFLNMEDIAVRRIRYLIQNQIEADGKHRKFI